MLSPWKVADNSLARALARKRNYGARGMLESRAMACGDGWQVLDLVCTSGPRDRPFEERFSHISISLVLAGTFVYRDARGKALMSPGSILLGNAGHVFECSHEHGEGDRCLSFQFEPVLFDRLVHNAHAPATGFGSARLPPSRTLAPLTARARTMIERPDSFEKMALEVAATVIALAHGMREDGPCATALDRARVAIVLRHLQSSLAEPHPLAELARIAGLSRYHFLRTFKGVTGVTPHQWILRMRLREAARLLRAGRKPITEIALAVGFEDLSNFVRSFHAEFGLAPKKYRATDFP